MTAHLTDEGVVNLQYNADTFLSSEHNHENIVNLKLLIYLIKVMFGFKIIFSKIEVLVIDGHNNVATYVLICSFVRLATLL